MRHRNAYSPQTASTGLHVLNVTVSMCVRNRCHVFESNANASNTSFTSDRVAKRMAFGLVFVRISTQAVVLSEASSSFRQYEAFTVNEFQL